MISEHRRPFLAFVLVAVFCAVVMGESLLAGQTTPRAQRVDITRIDSAGPAGSSKTSPAAGGAPASASSAGPSQPSTAGVTGAPQAAANTETLAAAARADRQAGKRGQLAGAVAARQQRKGGRAGGEPEETRAAPGLPADERDDDADRGQETPGEEPQPGGDTSSPDAEGQ